MRPVSWRTWWLRFAAALLQIHQEVFVPAVSEDVMRTARADLLETGELRQSDGISESNILRMCA
jgi:hypothetical protein